MRRILNTWELDKVLQFARDKRVSFEAAAGALGFDPNPDNAGLETDEEEKPPEEDDLLGKARQSAIDDKIHPQLFERVCNHLRKHGLLQDNLEKQVADAAMQYCRDYRGADFDTVYHQMRYGGRLR